MHGSSSRKRTDPTLERNLLKAWADCRGHRDRDPTAVTAPHQQMMSRFHSILDAAADRPVYVLEITAAIEMTTRSLSRWCEENLGIDLDRYLLLRRLHLARQTLCATDPASATTTSDVATRYGFWQFSQFAVQYKSYFGEFPFDTLRRSPKKPKAGEEAGDSSECVAMP
jgi:transcriptional regulator GlxA family with amidase domain